MTGESGSSWEEHQGESQEDKRKRLNKERMRRNRKDPEYREREQQRQRARRREKIAKAHCKGQCAKHFHVGSDPSQNSAHQLYFIQPSQFGVPMDPTHALTTHLQSIPTPLHPQGQQVLAVPVIEGYALLTYPYTLSVFSPLPTPLAMVMMDGKSSELCFQGTMERKSELGSATPIHGADSVVSQNLHLGDDGIYWSDPTEGPLCTPTEVKIKKEVV